jgi:hypothetical protein
MTTDHDDRRATTPSALGPWCSQAVVNIVPNGGEEPP